MMRRGAVVVPGGEGLPAVVIAIDGDDLLLAGEHGGYGFRAAHACPLDLRDETARAHAAVPYTATTTHCDIGPSALIGRAGCIASPQHWRTLCRMRMLDESVTVAEARAALDWAHAASGGGGE
jgi:hypothetical protein